MDINDLEKLRNLKDKGAITQEELDEQIEIYLHNEKNSYSDKRTNNGIKIRYFVFLGLFFIVIYIAVNSIFLSIIVCNENSSREVCNCIKQSMVRKIGFLDKLKLLIIGGSREELASYVDLGDLFRCKWKD